jgi:hypothetical protein
MNTVTVVVKLGVYEAELLDREVRRLRSVFTRASRADYMRLALKQVFRDGLADLAISEDFSRNTGGFSPDFQREPARREPGQADPPSTAQAPAIDSTSTALSGTRAKLAAARARAPSPPDVPETDAEGAP